MTWSVALPSVLTKIDQVLKLRDVKETQAAEIESIAELSGPYSLGISEAAHADDYDRLIVSVDRLREEIVTADAILDDLLKPITQAKPTSASVAGLHG